MLCPPVTTWVLLLAPESGPEVRGEVLGRVDHQREEFSEDFVDQNLYSIVTAGGAPLCCFGVSFAFVALLYANRGALPLELLDQFCARLHARKVFSTEDFKDISLHAAGCQVGNTALLGDCGAQLHERESQSIEASLSARQVWEDEKAAQSCIFDLRVGYVWVGADEWRNDKTAHQPTTRSLLIVGLL